MSIGAIGSHQVAAQPKVPEYAEAKGAPDHDGDGDDHGASASTASPTVTGPLQPGFSLHA